jgi:hypothetical protein
METQSQPQQQQKKVNKQKWSIITCQSRWYFYNYFLSFFINQVHIHK